MDMAGQFSACKGRAGHVRGRSCCWVCWVRQYYPATTLIVILARMKTSVYVETTVISYLTANISRDLQIAAHQQATIDWWQSMRPMVECYISPFVINEITHGDEQMAKRRLEAVEGFALLGVNEEIEKLAEQILCSY